MTLPYCPRFILVVDITRQVLFPWWKLWSVLHIVFTLPIATHFGNDHNIFYSVNIKRRACSGNEVIRRRSVNRY